MSSKPLNKKKKKKKKKKILFLSQQAHKINEHCTTSTFITMANKYWVTLVSVKENHFHDPLQ